MEFLDISDVETCVRELARFHAHARARPDPDADAEAAVALVSTRRVGDFVADVAAGSAALFKAAVDRGEANRVESPRRGRLALARPWHPPLAPLYPFPNPQRWRARLCCCCRCSRMSGQTDPAWWRASWAA